jgi:hypothetical protein
MKQLMAAFLATVLLYGCEAGGGVPASVRDSAGVVIVENAYPDSAGVTWWQLDMKPLVDIGSAAAEEGAALFQVGDALRLADGRIVVSNGGSSDVRYYSADGGHLGTSGRRGSGPGEFQRPQRLVPLSGDSVLVADAFNGRLTVLDSAGAFVRDFLLTETGPGAVVVGRMSDGTFMATQSVTARGEFRSGFQRLPVIFVRLSAVGAIQDTVVSVPGTEATIRMEGTPGKIESIRSIQIVRPPYTKQTLFAAAGDVLAVATQEAPEVRLFGLDGALRRIIRTGTPMPAVTEAHLEAWHERSRQSMPKELQAQARQRPEWPDAGKVVPPFGAIEIDDAGNLWLADYDDRLSPPGEWSIHDADGRLLARARVPATFRPMHIGRDFLLGVERDELDVEHVRMYRLRR